MEYLQSHHLSSPNTQGLAELRGGHRPGCCFSCSAPGLPRFSVRRESASQAPQAPPHPAGPPGEAQILGKEKSPPHRRLSIPPVLGLFLAQEADPFHRGQFGPFSVVCKGLPSGHESGPGPTATCLLAMGHSDSRPGLGALAHRPGMGVHSELPKSEPLRPSSPIKGKKPS